MKSFLRKCDKPLLFMTIFYVVIGLVMIYSASSVSAIQRYGVSSSYFFTRQLIAVGAATLFSILVIIRFHTIKYQDDRVRIASI